MKRKLFYVFAFLMCWFVVHTLIVTIDGLTDNPSKADCIVILGNKVNPDGTLSPRLSARVEKGLALYREGYATKIVVSGGLGEEGHYEGSVMRDFLVSRGVTREDVFVDDHGVNTYATAVYVDSLARANNFRSVIVVSQFFHITRTKQIIRRSGLVTYGAHADYFEMRDAYSLVREFFGFYKYLFLGRD